METQTLNQQINPKLSFIGMEKGDRILLQSPRLNANILKLIAVIAMIMQHVAVLYMQDETVRYYLIHEAGRITAPIMCFFIAEGYYHTADLKKYMTRLFIGVWIAHVPHALAFGFSPLEFWRATSIMWCLFLGLVALTVYQSSKFHIAYKLLVIVGCCILSYPGTFNCITVLWVLLFGVFRDRPVWKWAAFTLVTFLYIGEYWIVDTVGVPWFRLLVLAAIPLLMMYNGQLGRKSKVLQWGYYLIYPVHFLVLYAVGLIL